MVPIRRNAGHWGWYAAAGVATLVIAATPALGEQKPEASKAQQRGGRTPEISLSLALPETPAKPAAACADHESAEGRTPECREADAAEKAANNSQAQTWLFGAQALFLLGTLWVSINTGRRQLRAYVYVEEATLKRIGRTQNWRVEFTIKNNGSTPAREVQLWDHVCVVGPKTYPPPVRGEPDYLGSMAPHGDYFNNDSDDVRGVTIADLRSGEKVIFLVGRIEYRDVFKRKRVTNFCLFTGGEVGFDKEMSAYPKGNDST